MRVYLVSALLVFGTLLVPSPASASHVDCGESAGPDNKIEFRVNEPTVYVCFEQFCTPGLVNDPLLCVTDTEVGDDPGDRVHCEGQVEVNNVSTDPPGATICVDERCESVYTNAHGEELRPRCYAGDEISV